MADTSTKYLGLELKNPVACSSSPLCEDLDAIRRMEDAGAAAVVLHSLFEEQLELESQGLDYRLSHGAEAYSEALSYFPDMKNYNLGPEGYLDHLHKAKQAVGIPIIASLNGNSRGGWLRFARQIEQAGADALELNIYDVCTDPDRHASDVEDDYVDLVKELASSIRIPLAVKLCPFFTAPAAFGKRLANAGASGLVLFNRFYQPDLDLDNLDVLPRLHLSQSNELPLRLHWVAIMYDKVTADLAITGGVHTANDVIKCMMVGARVAMTTSALLSHGISHLRGVLEGVKRWLVEHEYDSIRQMQGSMSMRSIPDPRAYERGNYMKVLKSFVVRDM